MPLKFCTLCKEEKSSEFFGRDKRNKDGLSRRCKSCLNEYTQKYAYYQRHKEERKKANKKYRESNSDRRKELDKVYRSKKGKWLYERRKIRENALSEEEKSKKRQKIAARLREKIKTNAQFHVRVIMSNAIRQTLKQRNILKSSASWQYLVGYTAQELKEHLEKQFTSEMTWENYGSYWHIDHVRPQSWFEYKTVEDKDFKECWALSNLQPLEAKINIKKGNRREGK